MPWRTLALHPETCWVTPKTMMSMLRAARKESRSSRGVAPEVASVCEVVCMSYVVYEVYDCGQRIYALGDSGLTFMDLLGNSSNRYGDYCDKSSKEGEQE